MIPPDPWDEDMIYAEREDAEYVEPEEDDGEGQFTRTNPFGEKD